MGCISKRGNEEEFNMKYTTEKVTDWTTRYHITEPNKKGEKLMVEIVECKNHGGKNALPVLWKKHKFMDRVLETYLSVHTYCTDTNGQCWSRYNPQHKFSDDEKRVVINFDWMFENTEENKQKLLDEIIRLFESAEVTEV
jgi:hypothetical protein